jgi:DNA-binding XRE family transcriptional regulator
MAPSLSAAVSNLGDPDELALVAAGFPAFRLWREVTCEGTRYVAQGGNLAARPYAVVTGDLTELRAALSAGEQATNALVEARPTPQWMSVLDGQRLRQARRRHGLSQAQLAYLAGLSPATIARLEREPRPRCRARTQARLAAALGQQPASLSPAVITVAPGPAADDR